jgi:hypothetical protein
MRKLSIAVLAIAAAVAVASVAVAANVYSVHLGSTTVKGKGSTTKPIPTGVKLGFTVGESDPSKRATVIEKYAIGSEGLVTNPKFFPKCSFGQLDDATVPASCGKALVGTGLVKNAAGPSTDQSLSSSSPCNLALRLFNTGSGMAIRVDGGPPIPPSFESDTVGCALPIHTAINGRFVKRKIGGVVASDFVFTVPQNLKHPLTGIDNSIRRSDNIIRLKRKTVNGKRRGFYEKVGCKGTTRLVRATFTTEATASQAPQTFTATKTSKC